MEMEPSLILKWMHTTWFKNSVTNQFLQDFEIYNGYVIK
jgi:hypothetical protein